MPRKLDLTGQKYNKLTVLAEVEPKVYSSGERKSQYLCRCECGNVIKATGNALKTGNVKSCGCIQNRIFIGERFGSFTVIDKRKLDNGNIMWKCLCECGTTIEMPASRLLNRKHLHCGCQDSLVGERFNKLIVLEPYGKRKRPCGKSVNLWKCKCDCGNYTIVDTNSLRRDKVKSCGCLSYKHLENKSRLHQIWCGMRKRCKNPNNIAYKNYGGRGIAICPEWDSDDTGFLSFREWALKNGYKENLSLDRIDVNGNYTPDNCKWATPKEQARNTRKNKLITYKDTTKCLAEWAEEYNMTYSALISRLRRGWTIERALNTPVSH